MPVILILMDALKHNYIDKTTMPFLYNMASQGKYIEKIIPSAGFCERTEILFGLKPKDSGFFTAIGFDPEGSPYKDSRMLNILGYAENIVARLSSSLWKSKRYQIEEYSRKIFLKILYLFNANDKKLGAYNIPFNYLKYFNLTEDQYDLHKIDMIKGKKSIIKIISEFNGEAYMGAFTALGQKSHGDDKNRLRLAIEACRSKNNLFIPIYIAAPDYYGHKYGPDSQELKAELKRLDILVKDSYKKILEINSHAKFIFLGDHGMTNVNCTINIKHEITKIAEKHNLKEESDFIYFLDSTLLRIWYFSKRASRIFQKEIRSNNLFSEKGLIINDELLEKYCLPLNNRQYGDLIWSANPGVLIYPDYFHKSKIMKGMHGYRPDDSSTYGMGILWHKNIAKEKIEYLELNKMYDEIINLLRK